MPFLFDQARRLMPSSSDPERFHIDKSELIHGMQMLKRRVCPHHCERRTESERPVTTIITVRDGKTTRMSVQRRRLPFAINHG